MKKWILPIVIIVLASISLMATVFASDNPKYDEVISYVYLESPELLVGNTQKIGIILNDEICAEDLILVYQSETTGTKYRSVAQAVENGAVSFLLEPEEQEDTYQVVELRYKDASGDKCVVIHDNNFSFRVVANNNSIVTVEPLLEAEKVDATMQKRISTAVSEGLKNTILNVESPVLFSNTGRVRNIVLALDAGHDSSHAGAQANGISEEIVTLKLAQYAKEELETYAGVTVYMTRTGAECPYPETKGSASGKDIIKRIDAAVERNAQAVISFHLNSYTSSGPKGCLVLAPQGNSSVAVDAVRLAKDILEKLCAVGFENDGVRQEDQWTITSYAKQKGIPGIIIEHGFITNPEDSAKLKNEAYIKAMGIADAQGIAEFYGLQKKSTTEIPLHVGGGKYYIESALNADITLDIRGNNGFINQKGQSLSQDFYIKRLENGFYQILNQQSGMALGVAKNSQENNLQIEQSVWTGADNQLWTFVVAEEGYCYIKSKLGTYLTRVQEGSPSGSNVVAYEQLGMEKQGWKITAFEDRGTVIPFLKRKAIIGVLDNKDVVSEGIFTIRPNDEMGIMTIEGSAKEDLANVVIQAENTSTVNQQWSFVPVDDRYYRLVNLNSGKVLTVKYEADGTSKKVLQATWNQEETQMWQCIPAKDGSYYVCSKSGDYLGVDSDNVCVKPAAEKQMWTLNNKGYTIMGESNTTVMSMVNYYNSKHKDYYPGDILAQGGAPAINDFCQIVMEEARAEGVRAEIVLAQAILETGWLKYEYSSVKPEWYNFCGLGAITTNPSGNAAHFTNVREGIRAQVQHLKAYGSKDALVNECVDPRFHLVTRGCSPYVQWLGEKENPKGYGWAVSQGYGNTLMQIVYDMLKY